MAVDGPYRRRTARVILLDRRHRVLLLRFRFDPADVRSGHGWVTPGGGVDGDEAPPETAARELREEIGLAVPAAALGRPVAYRAGYADLGWVRGQFRDDFFLHRVGDHRVDTSGMAVAERGRLAGHRWWPAGELAAATDVVEPALLTTLVGRLASGDVPGRPVRLPWPS